MRSGDDPPSEDRVPLASLIHDPEALLAEGLRLSAERRRRIEAAAGGPRLPAWADSQRAAPNEVVRSALFNARNRRTPRQYLRSHVVALIGEGRITYTGEELRQDDADVWMQILHLARCQPLGEWVEFTAHELIGTLGWPNSGQSYTRLKECLTRMTATALAVQSQRLGLGASVSMIRKFEWKDSQGRRRERWRVWIEPEIKTLFGDLHYTLLDWERRRCLGPLAKWLHAFYGSHAQPYPVKVETLRQGSGSGVGTLRKFRQSLKSALRELVAVGFLDDWRVDSADLVHVVRAGKPRS